MQDYVAKESSLLDLKTEKLELTQGTAEGGAGGDEGQSSSKLLKPQRSTHSNQDSLEEVPMDG